MFRQISQKNSYNKLSRDFHKIKSKNDVELLKKSSKIIRNEFTNYFTNLNHKLIPSSRVVPLCDSSLSFVNAGMIQFKGIFLNRHSAPAPRATNSQKCIRVGGKHNDLSVVGLDSYHHTFFEMLGNWSFNDYKKLEACSYAWNLLTTTFGISKNRLYVTYFKGDESFNLPADYETREIWRKLGVPDERILSFGVKDNFWEMGVSGPCGPCTEIHIDHNCLSSNQAFKVNQGHADLTELWNIVFIQHQRLQDGSIIPLDHQHVDTGMGFERLVAILQGKNSNYDTDLFQPLFDVIQKKSGCPFYQGNFGDFDAEGIDTNYRVLADHARMMTVALADGIIPEENYKLRRVLRRAVTIASDTFKSDDLLQELSYHVAESLGDAYPEIKNNMPQIQKIIEYEKEVWKSLMKSSGKQWQEFIKSRPILATISEQYHSGLVTGYKRLQSLILNDKINKISGDLALELFLSHSLDLETISDLAKIEGLGLDEAEYYRLLDDHKMNSRLGIVGQGGGQFISDVTLEKLKSRVASTDDSSKYNYSFVDNRYQFPVLETKIAGILVDGELIEGNSLELSKKSLEGRRVAIVLEKTSMFAREGGQQSDCGKILINNVSFIVKGVRKSRNFIVHLGNIDISSLIDDNKKISTGDGAKVYLDEEARIGLMRHHTATHLLNAALRKIYPVVVQRGSVVKENELTFIFSGFGDKIRGDNVETLEKIINDSIQEKIPVVMKKINGVELMGDMDLILLPGEVYPDVDLRIIDINGSVLQSKEACCGTHVHNTSALKHFTITDVTANGPTSRTIKAVAGERARDLKSASIGLREKSKFQKFENTKSLESFKKTMYTFVEEEIREALRINKDPSFFVHCIKIRNNVGSQGIPLQYAIECNPDLPQFLIGKDNRTIRARCFVPKKYLSSTFNARLWMEHVSPIIGAEIGSFDDENPLEVSHTKKVKFPREEIDDLTNRAIEAARYFISSHLKINHQQEDSKKS